MSWCASSCTLWLLMKLHCGACCWQREHRAWNLAANVTTSFPSGMVGSISWMSPTVWKTFLNRTIQLLWNTLIRTSFALWSGSVWPTQNSHGLKWRSRKWFMGSLFAIRLYWQMLLQDLCCRQANVYMTSCIACSAMVLSVLKFVNFGRQCDSAPSWTSTICNSFALAAGFISARVFTTAACSVFSTASISRNQPMVVMLATVFWLCFYWKFSSPMCFQTTKSWDRTFFLWRSFVCCAGGISGWRLANAGQTCCQAVGWSNSFQNICKRSRLLGVKAWCGQSITLIFIALKVWICKLKLWIAGRWKGSIVYTKNSAKNFACSGSFEPAILTKLLMIQEEQLRDIMPEPYLQSPTSDPSLASRCQCTSAEVGQTLRYQSQSYHAGDMCLFDDDPGKAIKILQCCSLLLPGSNSWSFYLLGEDLQRATDIRASDDQWHFSQWRSIGSQSLIPMSSRASRIMIPLLWWQSGEIVTVSCWHLSSRILAVWKTNSGLVDALFEINLSKLFLEQMQDD